MGLNLQVVFASLLLGVIICDLARDLPFLLNKATKHDIDVATQFYMTAKESGLLVLIDIFTGITGLCVLYFTIVRRKPLSFLLLALFGAAAGYFFTVVVPALEAIQTGGLKLTEAVARPYLHTIAVGHAVLAGLIVVSLVIEHILSSSHHVESKKKQH